MQAWSAQESDAEGVGDGIRAGDLVGVIRHRLLINRWVDPDEVVALLPEGVRPRVGSTGGVIVGCCLIALDGIRPWPLPNIVGRSVQAAAHRISVEAGSFDQPTNAVFVPMRHTDSRATVMIGGRLFPGAHQRSTVLSSATPDRISWQVEPRADAAGPGFAITATASRSDSTPAQSEVAEIVVGTALGLSPNHRGRLEGAEMQTFNLQAEAVTLTELQSEFLDGFSSAVEAETLLMTDVGVTWRRASADPA